MNEEIYDHCQSCDHSYQPDKRCIGTPIPCEHCCTNSVGELVYAPQYIIEELVLS